MRRPIWCTVVTVGAAALMGAGAGAAVLPDGAGASRLDRTVTSGAAAALRDPAALVRPLDGTGVGPANPGNVSEYPGASVPFGMVQFSPDTSPDRGVTTGSGYDFADSNISGFSLTHLSGDGCPIYGDIPILPVVGAVPADPDAAVQPFSHTGERASPGDYSVRVGAGNTSVGVQLTATTRTAQGAFSFSPLTSGHDILLFKVDDSANGSTASAVQIVGNDELSGSVTSGDFCGIPGAYTLYFTAQFSQPFAQAGTWQGGSVTPDGSCAGTSTASCGAWVSFSGPGQGGQTVQTRVGISFVSAAGAAANLHAEDRTWDFPAVVAAATAQWNRLLSRVAVSGGSPANRRTFYTALYHSLMFPSVFSDDDGRYVGFDHTVHRLARGQVQYSNISEADIYRSEVPLLATLLPGPTSQMVQSLLRDAAQTKGGYLPKWVIADNDAGQWDGDSADPIIADAYAFGARRFNVTEALADMVHGATVPESGFIVERANLAQYLSHGWVPQLTYDITSYPYTDGGSETLEYALDDFSIAQLARAAGNAADVATFSRRAENWQNLFDGATGYLAARTADGSFPPGPAFQPANLFSQLQGIAQQGFEEGNAIQYTWSVPQDFGGLIALMGGDRAAVSLLDTFFTNLNATRFEPYDWAGNEPSLWAPYVYDYAGAPYKTQSVVRRIMTELYADAAAAEPGEDDLGALSSWYVWSALGLYPETPGVAGLAITGPLFAEAHVALGNGHTLTVVGAHAPDEYIERARVAIGDSGSGSEWNSPWLPAAALEGGATLALDLGPTPDVSWGAAASVAPPSFSQGGAPAVAFTLPGGALQMSADSTATLQLGIQEAGRSAGSSVRWHVVPSPGLVGVRVSPADGTFEVKGRSLTPLQLTSGSGGTFAVTIDVTQAGKPLPSLVVDVHVSS